MNDLLQQGIAAAKAGQREHARELLIRVVEQDEENALAWLWLSGVVDSLDDREVCLENVLSIEPDNALADKGLQVLRQKKVEQLVREGIAAAKEGQREHARKLLMRAVEYDERNIPAWLWLSGVANDLEERQACLENILSLDPYNAAARRGLDQIQEQQKQQPASALAESIVVTRAQTSVTPAAAMLRDDFASQRPQPELDIASPAVHDEFDDEYLCPYCAAPTEPDDRRCRACRGKLVLRFLKQEQRSVWLWLVIISQGFVVISNAITTLVFAVIVFSPHNQIISEAMTQTARQTGVSVSTIKMQTMITFIIFLLAFLFSLAFVISLYLRWKPAYYLFFAVSALGAVMVIMVGVLLLSLLGKGGSVFLCLGIYALVIGGLRLWIAIQMQHDFDYTRVRLLFRIDQGVVGAPMLLAWGHEYAKRKMWGLAALHLRRGVAFMPEQMDGRGSLALTYLKLKRYDLAAQVLADARRIAPNDPRIEELQTLLDDMRSGGK